MQGRVIGIATRAATGAPMEEHQALSVSCEAGLSGDYRRKPGKRQVTVMPVEGWQAACAELGQTVGWTVRRSNLLIEGLALGEAHVGQRLVLGELVLEITGETDPCRKMDEAVPGLRRALEPDWRGGVNCRVLRGGELAVGQTVSLSA